MSGEMEERLQILQALSGNPQYEAVLRDALEVQREGEASVERGECQLFLGFEWFEVHTNPVTLNKMVTARLLDVSFSSNRSTYYKLHNPSLIREALEHFAEPEVKPESEMPQDLFRCIVGHENIKTLVRYAIESEKPAHMLLQGVPASAKTLFLLELRRLPNSYYCLAQTMTGPGLADVLFLRQPQILLIDEIDRLSPENIGVLNSLLATGIISESKVGKTRTMELGTKVFAAGINVRRLPADLLSRFIALKFQPYTEREFIAVCENILTKEGCSVDTAGFIGAEVWRMYETNADIRKAVMIARLASGDEGKIREVVRTLKQVGV